MQEIKEFLASEGCGKEETEACIQAITNINGDHLKLYQMINALCVSQDELDSLKTKLAGVVGDLVKPEKRPYVRRPKQETAQSLIEKSGVGEAQRSLEEQKPEITVPSLDDVTMPHKRQPRKKESAAEIKANVDALTGGVKLSDEEAAANLTIDL